MNVCLLRREDNPDTEVAHFKFVNSFDGINFLGE